MNKAIREATTKALREYLDADMENIKIQVAKELKNQRSPLTRALMEGIVKAASDMARYQISVSVTPSNR